MDGNGNGNGTLVAHAGGKMRTRAELATLFTPAATDTWKPVAHWELVGHLHDGLERAGITVCRDKYATAGAFDAKLFGVLDLVVPNLDTPDYRMALGIRASNDKSMAIQCVAGARVFVCDNMAFSGDGGTVVLRKKHTSRLDLSEVVPPAIDSYLEKAGAFVLDIDRMRNHELTADRAKALLFDAFAGLAHHRPVMHRRLFPVVSRLYFDDDEQRARFPERSLWALNNAFTEAVKRLPTSPQEKGLIAIGRYFGRVVRKEAKALGTTLTVGAALAEAMAEPEPAAGPEAEPSDEVKAMLAAVIDNHYGPVGDEPATLADLLDAAWADGMAGLGGPLAD